MFATKTTEENIFNTDSKEASYEALLTTKTRLQSGFFSFYYWAE